MTIEQAIYTQLNAANLRASYAQRLQGTALPAVVYTVSSIEPVRSLGGYAGLRSATISTTSIGETYAEARTTANAARAALAGTTGTVSGVVIAHITHDGDQPDELSLGEGEEDLPATIASSFICHFKEA